MTQTIARMYASQDAANAAVNELHEHGFKADATPAAPQPRRVQSEDAGSPDDTTPPAEPVASPADPGIDAIMNAGVEREHARIYSERIQSGEVLVVVVDPPFGFAKTALDILDSHNPVAVDLPVAEVTQAGRTQAGRTWDWRSPTPLSSWLGWRVLSDDPTPLSNYLNRPVLKAEPASSRTLEGIRKQSGDAAPLSSKLGMAPLSENPAPLSAKFGWRLLSEKAAPLSERFGWRTLSNNPTPLSTKFGWRVLSDNPTPLSSKLGWKVLSRK